MKTGAYSHPSFAFSSCFACYKRNLKTEKYAKEVSSKDPFAPTEEKK